MQGLLRPKAGHLAVRDTACISRKVVDVTYTHLQFEIAVMTDSLGTADQRIAQIQLLERVSTNNEVANKSPNDVAWALERATWRSLPQISAYVYPELQATGNLSLTRSDELPQGLAE